MYQEFYQRGVDKAHQKDSLGAIKEFNRALKINPEFADAYYQRGIAHFDLKNIQGAITDYNQALQIDPSYIDAYFGRGIARLALGDAQKAIEDADRLIDINPNNAAAFSLKGTAYRRLGDTQAAITNFKKAAEIYLDQKDVVKCRQCLDNIKQLKVLELQSLNNLAAKNFLNLALEKVMLGNYDAAIEDFDWLVKLNPQDEQAYYNRGLLYYKLGDYWNAIADFTQALSIKPSNPEIYYNRAITRSAVIDNEGAIADFDLAASLFRQQGDIAGYKKVLESKSNIEASQTYRLTPTSAKSNHNTQLQQKLLRLFAGNFDAAQRLLDLEKEKNPGKTDDWYYEKVIYDLERDRRI